MPHDDFLTAPPAKPKKKKGGVPEHGVRGIAIRFKDGTCGLLNFDTGEVDVWIVGERPAPGFVTGCRQKRPPVGSHRLAGNTYACFFRNAIGLGTTNGHG